MARVLYLTNIEVPYRISFFNELARICDLTVMFERSRSENRDSKWAGSVEKSFKSVFLNGKNIGNEYSFSFKIIALLKQQWDAVIVGCYNSLVQIFAMGYMKAHHIPYIINLDGEPFIGRGVKARIKSLILKSTSKYLIAGVKSAELLRVTLGEKRTVVPYYFSSLTDADVKVNADKAENREDFVLVVGQYFDYKGMDVAFQAACKDCSIRYKFVGMGSRTDLFNADMGQIPDNVEVIPFLQKEDLNREYQRCAMLLLPTRQECWGLVVNEAASFGTPIVSTWGSGAAVEFLADKYPQYLAEPGNADSLLLSVRECLNSNNEEYSQYLKEISKNYTIERSAGIHADFIAQI